VVSATAAGLSTVFAAYGSIPAVTIGLAGDNRKSVAAVTIGRCAVHKRESSRRVIRVSRRCQPSKVNSSPSSKPFSVIS